MTLPDNEHLKKHADEEAAFLIGALTKLRESVAKAETACERNVAAGKIAEYFRCNTHAIQIYSDVLKDEPACWEALARLAIVHLRTGLHDEGMRLASSLVQQQPGFRFTNLGGDPTSGLAILGDSFRLKSEHQNAAKVYRQAVDLERKDGYAIARLAQSLLLSGAVQDAIELLPHLNERPAWDSLKATLQLAKKDPNGAPTILGMKAKEFSMRDVI